MQREGWTVDPLQLLSFHRKHWGGVRVGVVADMMGSVAFDSDSDAMYGGSVAVDSRAIYGECVSMTHTTINHGVHTTID